MKNKLMYLTILLMLGMMGLVYGLGSVSIVTPAAGDTITSTTQVVNITYTNNELTTINCTLQVTSTLTANTTGYDLFNVSNSSSALHSNRTYNFRGFEDANNYVFTTVCTNGSTSATDSNTGIIIDFTDPDAPSSPTDLGVSWIGSEDLSYTVTDGNTTSCTLNIGSTVVAATYSSSTCSYTYTKNEIPSGVYNLYMTASDETDTAVSTVSNIKIDNQLDSVNPILLGDVELSKEDAAKLTGKNNNLIFLAIIGVIIYFGFFSKNKWFKFK